jgi:hypothetical protein
MDARFGTVVWLPVLLIFTLLVLRTNMYTQALNSGGGLAQRLNQHFYFEAIRVWDLSAMPFHQSGAGCFFFILEVDKTGHAPRREAISC